MLIEEVNNLGKKSVDMKEEQKRKKEYYMNMALELAQRAEGYTSPNPMVGCVVVKNGEVVAKGYHERYGEFHAERNALTRYQGDLSGADLYVTLEPCCHYGKTPPCTEIIMQKRIKRVFVGSMDSNPLVAGKGVQILRDNGIYVETGILEQECRKLNEVFYYYMETGLPFVAMKYAMTLDGKIACESGDSKWITSESARKHVHVLRKKYKGIMAGIGTVLKDNPMLNVRLEGEKIHPTRIICDTNLKIPMNSKIVETAKEIPTIVACGEMIKKDSSKQQKIEELHWKGVSVIYISQNEEGYLNLRELMKVIYGWKIDGILLEGGGTLNSSMLNEGLVNKVYAYIAPKMIGGSKALSPIEGKGVQTMSLAKELKNVSIETIDHDILVTGYLKS